MPRSVGTKPPGGPSEGTTTGHCQDPVNIGPSPEPLWWNRDRSRHNPGVPSRGAHHDLHVRFGFSVSHEKALRVRSAPGEGAGTGSGWGQGGVPGRPNPEGSPTSARGPAPARSQCRRSGAPAATPKSLLPVSSPVTVALFYHTLTAARSLGQSYRLPHNPQNRGPQAPPPPPHYYCSWCPIFSFS